MAKGKSVKRKRAAKTANTGIKRTTRQHKALPGKLARTQKAKGGTKKAANARPATRKTASKKPIRKHKAKPAAKPKERMTPKRTKRTTRVRRRTVKESMNAAETYLTRLKEIRGTGSNVPETSFYGALETLFNAVGKSLSPKVSYVINVRKQGAGIPDGGLFSADQLNRSNEDELFTGLPPSRGAVEVKPPSDDADETANSEQVVRYLQSYGIVLVTNLREFLIVERTAAGPAIRERFTLAENERDFWRDVVAHPRKFQQERGAEFFEFIQRACLHNAELSAPDIVAWFMASYARVALDRVERRAELPALKAVREGLEDALGMKFTGDKGEHFFRSTLVQTVFYGIFSAWVLWHRQNPGPGTFNWREAEWTLHVPFINALYNQLATPAQLGSLKLVEILEWTAAVLNRVRRADFFARFAEDHAVQYFYEPFLREFDPELRKELGVWYTPPEIVKYQVARVDTVLREELGIADGLADPNVIVLDPCCGTGAYLVEVLKHIADKLREQGAGGTLAARLKTAAIERVFGFEILPAPFVVSHLQLGLLLQEQGAPLNRDNNERVGVYLTNALTGWQPPAEPKTFIFPELGEEHDRAAEVKRDKRILVVLGNPPYNAFAGVSPDEESGLIEPYKENLNRPTAEGGWGIMRFSLHDLYVRFFRLAERRIADMSGLGVVSFISNFSYLADPSFVVMRQRFLGEFDSLWFDCLNGDSRETGKLTPAGLPDPSVFSTDYNREGIRVGTTVSVLARREERAEAPRVRFRHFWGTVKRAELLESLNSENFNDLYALAEPANDNRFSFRPEVVSEAYRSWPLLTQLCEVAPSNGLMEKRGGSLIDIDREELAERMQDYFSSDLSWEDYHERHTALTQPAARFKPKDTRQKAVDAEGFRGERLRRYAIRPFDTLWCYYTGVRPVWNEPRPALWRQMFSGNRFVICRPAGVASPEGMPLSFTRCLGDNDYQRGHSYYFPVRVLPTAGEAQRRGQPQRDAFTEPVANLSAAVRAYLAELGLPDPDTDARVAGLVWLHALAIGYSGAYLSENADGIRRDWPRVPLPRDRTLLEASAALGERVAALLDTEAEVPGVTTGTLEPLFRSVGNLQRGDGEQINPDSDDLSVTAGWGHGGDGKPVMPGKGKADTREPDSAERDAIAAQAAAMDLEPEQARQLLGDTTMDVYLNGEVFWRNVPDAVWNYHIGGYQVVKKWLSYREKKVLRRNIRLQEADEVTSTIRRLTALVLLGPALDHNYHACAAAPQYPIAGVAQPATTEEEE